MTVSDIKVLLIINMKESVILFGMIYYLLHMNMKEFTTIKKMPMPQYQSRRKHNNMLKSLNLISNQTLEMKILFR